MATESFNFDTLQQILLHDVAFEYEYQESDESDDEIFLDLNNSDDTHSREKQTNSSMSTKVTKIDNIGDDYYLGKDKVTKWSKFLSKNVDRNYSDLLFETAGPSTIGSKANAIDECFRLFIDDEVLKLITDNTNSYITSIRHHYNRDRDCNETNADEIKTVIGLLLLISLFKSKNQNFDELWESNGLGVDVFRLAMNLNRFKFLLRCMRFHHSYNNHTSIDKADKFAAIRNLFKVFNAKCQNNFTTGSDVTLYEQIIEYKGNCPSFKSTKSESPRFGMKIYTLVDTCFNYILNMEIFIQNRTNRSNNQINSAESYVQHLTDGFQCNLLLMDDLASFALMSDLLVKNITAIGKLNGSELKIPEDSQDIFSENQTHLLYEEENKFLLSCYSDDNKKNMLMLSTVHDIKTTNYQTKKLADEYYVNAAYGIEKLKNFFSENSISRRTRRFSLRIWFHLIDVAIVNSFIIYSINNNLKILRRNFLKQLGLSLVNEAIKKRAMNRYLSRQLREDAAQFSGSDSFCPKISENSDNRPKRCSVCSRSKDIKVRTSCCSCKLPMCKKHMELICQKCFLLANNKNRGDL